MNISNILTGLCSIFFFMIGADKFLAFLEPACSLVDSIPSGIWKSLGVLQLFAGVLIWLPKFKKYIVGFFTVFMLVFIIVHLTQGTYDVGGAIFMGIMLGLLTWNPPFIQGKK